jgi:hypothetical protein
METRMETRKEIETAICKRVCNFASSIIAASDGVHALQAIKDRRAVHPADRTTTFVEEFE